MNYSKLTLAELREECIKKGIDERGKKKKDLINLLKFHNDKSKQTKKSIEEIVDSSQLSSIKERMEKFRCKNGEQTVPESLIKDIGDLEKIQARKNRFTTNKK